MTTARLTDMPRTIWATAANKNGHMFANAERLDDAPHRHHHDAVVRELVEVLGRIADLSVVAASDMAVIALRKHRAALAKIARETPHD